MDCLKKINFKSIPINLKSSKIKTERSDTNIKKLKK